MERGNARRAEARATSVIPASVRWIGIPITAMPARTRATADLAGVLGSSDGSRAVQTLWGGTLKIDATNEEDR